VLLLLLLGMALTIGMALIALVIRRSRQGGSPSSRKVRLANPVR